MRARVCVIKNLTITLLVPKLFYELKNVGKLKKSFLCSLITQYMTRRLGGVILYNVFVIITIIIAGITY